MDENKTIARRWMDAFNRGDIDAVGQLFDAEVVDHTAPPGLPAGSAGMQAQVQFYRGAMPDLHFTVEDLVAEGDTVACRWSARGTHTGPLLNIPPSGRSAQVTGIFILRVANGKVVEHWVQFDQLGMLQQFGVIPAPGQ